MKIRFVSEGKAAVWLPAMALLWAVSGALAAAQADGLPGPAFPEFKSAAQVRRACDDGLRRATRNLRVLEGVPASKEWIAGYDKFYSEVEDEHAPIEFIRNVHPDQGIRDAAEACETRWQDFLTSVGQDAKLFRAGKGSPAGDDIDREALKQTLEGFEDSGVGLQPADRARAKQLAKRIGELGQQFDKNIRDEKTRLAFEALELKGVPDQVLKSARRDAKGRYLLGLDYPTYFPVMEQAENATTRERMWRAKMNEGGPGNLKILGNIAKLRRDYARLFGFDSYADFTLRRNMAGNVANVDRFLAEVKHAVDDGEKRDMAALREVKARHLGQPLEHTAIQRWDVSFYTERLRKERFSVDQASFRPYFPPEESLSFVMRIAETMFGIRYTAVPAKLWHSDARAYAIHDAATNEPLATLYVDLYPRDGKYGHAAVWQIRSGSTRASRLPQAALVVNFDRKGLTIEELDTLLHEFGHSLHVTLSDTRYALNAGTNTRRDFVEAPSQMLEDWVFDREVLKLFEHVCASCTPVPDELIDKARAAREFNKGSQTARQHLYASFDLALHGRDAPEPMALWRAMEGQTLLGYVPGTMFPAGFSHVAGDYGAGYYGYLWSLVVAMDLRTAFAGHRLDPVVGKRYRATVLSQGGQRPPEALLRDFLGRETSPKAFFDYLAR